MAESLSNLVVLSGLIGNGKTLRCIQLAESIRKAEGCDVYYEGIPEVKLPWKQLSLVPSGYTEKEITEKRFPRMVPDWREVPAGAICIIDEAWRYFPKRPVGHKPPDYVEQLAVVRHKGIRLILITQDPHAQLDTFVRGLVNEHHFLERKFGAQASRIYSWGKIEDQGSSSAKKEALTKLWPFPRELYGTYKSSEQHTVKAKWPVKKFATLGIAVVVVVAGMGYGIHHLRESVGGKPPEKTSGVSPGGQPLASAPLLPTTGRDYWVANRRQRVAGVPASAGIFDPLQKVRSQPRPVGCMQLVIKAAVRCQCFGPSGAVLDMATDDCVRTIKLGVFDETQSYPDVKQENIARLNRLSSQADSAPEQTAQPSKGGS